MVTVINKTPTGSAFIGQAIGQGLGGGLQKGINSSLDEFFQQRKVDRTLDKFFSSDAGKNLKEDEGIIRALAQGLIPPQAGVQYLKQKQDAREQSAATEYFKDFDNSASVEDRIKFIQQAPISESNKNALINSILRLEKPNIEKATQEALREPKVQTAKEIAEAQQKVKNETQQEQRIRTTNALKTLDPSKPFQEQIRDINGLDIDIADKKAYINTAAALERARLSAGDKAAKTQAELEADDVSYNKFKSLWGDKFADAWRAASEGGRTALIKSASELSLRGLDVDQIFRSLPDVANNETPPPPGKYQLDTKGMTPAEIQRYKTSLRKENLPLFTQASDKLRANRSELNSITTLSKINESGKLPQDLGRIIINPLTGEPYALAQLVGVVNPETQLWIKTINDFTTKAKDSYGSRVTNFDLQQYMKRLPGLLNTAEGRRLILSQMRVVNELDSIYNDAIKEEYSKHSLGGITPEDVHTRAERRISSQQKALEDEYWGHRDQLESFISNSPQQTERQAKPTEFETLPPAADYKGRIIEDDQGNRFKSNGKNWSKI